MPARVHAVEPPAPTAPAVFGVPGLVGQTAARVQRVLHNIVDAGKGRSADRLIPQAVRRLQAGHGGGQAVGPADGEDLVLLIAAVRALFGDADIVFIVGQPSVAGNGPGQQLCRVGGGRAGARRRVPQPIDGLQRRVQRALAIHCDKIIEVQREGNALPRRQRQAVFTHRGAGLDVVGLHKQPGRVFVPQRVADTARVQ